MAHITGGGLYENLPRIIRDGFCAEVDKSTIEIPEIFKYIMTKGVKEEEMWGTFNMGVGFAIVVNPADKQTVLDILAEQGEKAFEMGVITTGEEKICLK
jgi:phosphoribosylformylglycinamidine cyclo-ligase